MNIYILLFVFAILLGLLYQKMGNTPQNRKQYIFIFLSLLTGESCLRGLSIGSDTRAYYWTFERYRYVEWSRIWGDFIARYFRNENTEDIGFGIYMKFIHLISHNFSFFLFVSALFFFIPLGVLLYRYINDNLQLMFVFVLYISLFNMVAMSGVRKEIALGFAIWAFLYYVEEKYVYASVVLLIGATIHQTILLMLLIPLIALLPPKWIIISHLVAFLMIPIFILFSGKIIIGMANISLNERYLGYGEHEAQGGGVTFLILIELVSLFCLIALHNQLMKNENHFFKKLYSMLPLFTIFAPLITNNGSMIRISQYFHIYILILIPKAIENYFAKKKWKLIYIILMVFLIILVMISGTMKYIFIWQDNMII